METRDCHWSTPSRLEGSREGEPPAAVIRVGSQSETWKRLKCIFRACSLVLALVDVPVVDLPGLLQVVWCPDEGGRLDAALPDGALVAAVRIVPAAEVNLAPVLE